MEPLDAIAHPYCSPRVELEIGVSLVLIETYPPLHFLFHICTVTRTPRVGTSQASGLSCIPLDTTINNNWIRFTQGLRARQLTRAFINQPLNLWTRLARALKKSFYRQARVRVQELLTLRRWFARRLVDLPIPWLPIPGPSPLPQAPP